MWEDAEKDGRSRGDRRRADRSPASTPHALMAATEDPEVKQTLLDNTNMAFEAGAFGSPSFLVGRELYFGKDRLRDVEEALAPA